MPKNGETFEGPITMTRKGFGFFPIEGQDVDVLIPPEATRDALYGDTVKIKITGTTRDPKTGSQRPTGAVLEVEKRSRETFVGTVVKHDEPGTFEGKIILAPDYKKMHVPLLLRGDNLPLGDKVLVKLGGWDENEPAPWGTIQEVIGKAGVHETEMRALALGQGFNPEFPPSVKTEAERLKTEGRQMLTDEVARIAMGSIRKDFRAAPTCTIDPVDAKDFDDALSVRTLPDGNFEIGVHIADVSFFVRPGDSFDREAQERATSVYLVDRTIPMLPEILSNDLCSLNANQDRLAVSAVFTLDKDANVLSKWFGETAIHSDRRYTYEDAQKTLDEGAGDLHEELTILRDLSKKIRTRRVAKGSVDFDTAEVKVELDAAGTPIAIHIKERKDTNLMIEDFMLLANEAVAEHLSELVEKDGRGASIYRIHDAPDADRIENLTQFLRVMGYNLNSKNGKVTGAELNRLLASVKGTPEEYLIKTATLRSMAKAIYSTRNIGHFGLAFDFYTHFTSPIRRYPDLMIHRLIKAHAGGEPVTNAEMQQFEALAAHCSAREVGATEAERDSVKMKQVEFLSGRVGEVFDAVISGVSDRGLYVEELTTRAGGMIRITMIGDDYFEYDEKHYRLVGRRTKKTFQLGDPIKVKLIAARIPEKELDFVPA